MRKKAFSRVVQKVFPDAKAVAAPAPPRRAPREEADSKSLLAALVKQYFDWIVAERQLSARTVHSYRDAMVLFLRYIADTIKKRIEQLTFGDDFVSHLVAFLRHLESYRGVSVATRNHRLSVVRAFCRFVAYQNPLLATACRTRLRGSAEEG